MRLICNSRFSPRTKYGKTIKGAVNHFFILSNPQLIKTKNQLVITFVSPCGDNVSWNINQLEQLSPHV